jgi:hypothetical protein
MESQQFIAKNNGAPELNLVSFPKLEFNEITQTIAGLAFKLKHHLYISFKNLLCLKRVEH